MQWGGVVAGRADADIGVPIEINLRNTVAILVDTVVPGLFRIRMDVRTVERRAFRAGGLVPTIPTEGRVPVPIFIDQIPTAEMVI